jgi:N-methylhydantoinase A
MSQLATEGFAKDRCALEWFVEMRYRRQVHQVATPLRGALPVTPAALEQLQSDFEKLYEQRYGPGSSYRAAGVELVTFRLKARGLLPRPRIAPEPLGSTDPSGAERGRRPILFVDAGDWQPTTVYDFARLTPGNVVRGPTVVHSPVTTMVVQSGQIARLDGFRNLILESA